jgi:maleate isomerase
MISSSRMVILTARPSLSTDHLLDDAPPMRRLGVITPSSNTVVEPCLIRLAAPLGDQVSLHFARVPVTEVADDPKSDAQFGLQPMLDAASLLADARVDAIVWAGTSGSWRGFDADEQLVYDIQAFSGVPTTTTSLGLLSAFRALAVERYGLVVPYVKPIADAIIRNLDSAGYACADRTMSSITSNWDFATITSAAIEADVRTVAASRPDAVVILCTNVRGADVSERLEHELDIAILDSVVLSLWVALGALGIEPPSSGFGRLAKQIAASTPTGG